MSIVVHDARALERMRAASRAAAATLAYVGAHIRPGLRGDEIDALVREDTKRRGGRPSQLGYKGFPGSVCVSPNAVVCHGIPTAAVVLREGDIVNVDVTTELDGYHGDCSATFLVGEVAPRLRELVRVTRASRDAGIAAVRHGAHLGDVGAAIEAVARAHGMGIVRDFGGHGIGRSMHMAPHVPHFGRRGSGPRLRAGMTFTIEPMLTLGTPDVRVLADRWTVVTADGGPSAQFEHTVLVTRDGVEVLTLPEPEDQSGKKIVPPTPIVHSA
jgi:methionyl aminopeptidase